MTLIKRLNEDFITAMKAKDTVAKSAITSIKAKITEAEKSTTGFSGADEDVIKIISKAIKQREESQSIYEKAGRTEQASAEASEAAVLRNYMPSLMTELEITIAIKDIILELSTSITNTQALVGKSIGEFNKRYNGRADIQTVKSIITKAIA